MALLYLSLGPTFFLLRHNTSLTHSVFALIVMILYLFSRAPPNSHENPELQITGATTLQAARTNPKLTNKDVQQNAKT
jgi:hypothetical protein